MMSGRVESWRDVVQVVLISILVLLVIFALHMLLIWGYGADRRYDHISLAEVSRITHLDFLQSSSLLKVTGVPLMHTVLWVKLEMRPQDVKTFLQGVNKKHALTISRRKRLRSPGLGSSPKDLKRGFFDWWTPETARHFISAKSAISEGSVGTEITILADLDHPAKVVVYLAFCRD